ncbi:MAG: poly-gamma-glutamate hydrolase family protein [Gammaproteobacteria bacterium]
MKNNDCYTSYHHLSGCETEGRDYRRLLRKIDRSSVAVIAPHGGGIEPGTSRISMAVARDKFNLYLFEGIKPRGNKYLHVTSRNFDEPGCLDLVSRCETVIAIHGCKAEDERVFLGGLDFDLKQCLGLAFRNARLRIETDGHNFPAIDRDNICNRGRSGAGVQVEISGPLRRGRNINILIEAIRDVLVHRDGSAPDSN